ncbi:MAG: ABC transporter permease subunit, partial [Alphaproteobacteria bacterium]
PKGQYEAGHALGLSYWKEMRLIILPQALKISIPGIVSSFIGLFKDSTLVIIIGMLDPLGIGRTTLSDAKWQGLSTEVYVFVAVFFFICCFSMSRYSIYLEHKLETGHKR